MNKYSVYFALLILTLSFGCNENDMLLKDYDPVSIYNIPKTTVEKAKFPVIDFHTHNYPESNKEIEEWVKALDNSGIEKSIILSYETGEEFDEVVERYSKYEGHFDLWCGFDYTGYNEEGWSEKAVKELERCFKAGAKGVGELGDKGEGLLYSKPTEAIGMHIDDPRMQPLLKKCGELGMPISIHVAEPYWMYLPMDEHNDGMMNAELWQIDKSKENILLHDELVSTLENAVKNNPNTTFIACHLVNSNHDLNILGNLLDKYPNLYADISARFAEFAAVPRRTKAFFEKYQDRLLYGSDMGTEAKMYQTTFRILETADEHFYNKQRFGYHWPLNGLDLNDTTLKKMYSENARKILSLSKRP